MSNADGNNMDPNELDLPDGEDQLDGGLEELDLPDAEAPLEDLDQPSEEASSADSNAEADDAPVANEGVAESDDLGTPEVPSMPEESPKVPKESIGMAGMAVFGACGLSVLLLLVLDVMVFIGWPFLLMLLLNVFWLIATAIPFIMWMGRKTLNFYEVVLGIALAGVIIAVSLLLVEMADYDGEVSPKGGAAAAVQLGSDSTRAVA